MIQGSEGAGLNMRKKVVWQIEGCQPIIRKEGCWINERYVCANKTGRIGIVWVVERSHLDRCV